MSIAYEPRADIADRCLSLILGGHVAGKGAGLPPRAQNGGSGLLARESGAILSQEVVNIASQVDLPLGRCENQ